MRLVVILVAFVLTSGLAQDSDLLRQREQEVTSFEEQSAQRRAELARIEEELGATKAQLDEQIAARDALSTQLSTLQSERSALESNIDTAQTSLVTLSENLTVLERDVSGLKDRVSELLVSLYKQRGGRLARAIGQADSLHELRVRNYYLSRLTERDLALIEDLSTQTQISRRHSGSADCSTN